MKRFGWLPAALLIAFSAQARAAIETSAEHGLIMDAGTGQILWQKAGTVPMPPASMSKLMTLELLFERIKDGRVKLTDTFPVSENAWRTGGSKMFVKLGDQIPVESLIRGIIIDSGNDSCVVVAEALGGTVDGFVNMMNARAKELGLADSRFVNPDGLPDPSGQLMSAKDLASLARHIIVTFPQLYPYFNEHSFSWSGITQNNRDTVLTKLPGADGLKTGHTDAAGYGITSSAKVGNERLILVLNGLRYPDLDKASPARQDWVAGQRRGDEAARILGIAFREFRQFQIVKAGQIIGTAPVAGGIQPTTSLTTAPLTLVMQVDSHAAMKTSLTLDPNLQAPVLQGTKVGTLTITAPDFPSTSVPVYAAETVEHVGLLSGLWDRAARMIKRK